MLSQVINWLTLYCGCTDFSRVLKPRIEKKGELEKKWGPNGDPISEKSPHGDPGPQMGTHVGAVHFGHSFPSYKSEFRKKNSMKFITGSDFNNTRITCQENLDL